MAERGLWPKFFLIALPTLAVGLVAAWSVNHFWFQPRLEPLPFSGQAEEQFLGSISFNLPAEFQATSGRLQLLCQGPPSLTRIRELPHQSPSQAVRLTDLVPAEPPPFSLVEAETDFGRPALWALGQAGSNEVVAHLVLGFRSGAVILSRLFPADRLEEEKSAFTIEARQFAEKYAWGHEGAGSGERFSLHGRFRLDQDCRRFRGNVKFTALEAGLEFFWPGAGKPAPDDPSNGRLLRSGPRLLNGRPGQERVTLDQGSGSLTAVWRPEAKEEVVIFLSAPSFAAQALGYWDAILESVRFLQPPESRKQSADSGQPDGPATVPVEELSEPPESRDSAMATSPDDQEEQVEEDGRADYHEEPTWPSADPLIETREEVEPASGHAVSEEPVQAHEVDEPVSQSESQEDLGEWESLGLDFIEE